MDLSISSCFKKQIWHRFFTDSCRDALLYYEKFRGTTGWGHQLPIIVFFYTHKQGENWEHVLFLNENH